MNNAILHSAKPDKGKSRSKLPKAALQFAKQMGLDLNGLTAEAEDIWSMLDNMAANKPDEYSNFVQEQFENSKTSDSEQDGGKYFRPDPGFTFRVFTTGGDGIKVRDSAIPEKSGKKLFVNICSHKALEPPVNEIGEPVFEDRPTADGLQFPLLVGPIRDAEDGDGSPALAVDVLFHPSVIQKCINHTKFKKQVIELSLEWIKQETTVQFDSNWTLLKTSYMAGRGHNKDTPVLFSVDFAIKQTEGRNNQNKTEKTSNSLETPETLLRYMKTDENIDSISTPITTSTSILKSNNTTSHLNNYNDLTKDIVFKYNPDSTSTSSDEHINNTSGNKLGNSKNNSSRSGVKIQEIGIDSTSTFIDTVDSNTNIRNVSSDIDQNINKAKTAVQPLIKKGFLNQPGTSSLYPQGSTEGTGLGTYARFMDKCKIVDTSTMSPDEIQKMTREHAAPPSSTSTSTPLSSLSSVSGAANKHTIPAVTVEPKNKQPIITKQLQSEIDSLMSLVDDEYGNQLKSYDNESFGADQLKDMAKILGGSLDVSEFLKLPPSESSVSASESESSVSASESECSLSSSMWPNNSVSISQVLEGDHPVTLLTVNGLDKNQLRNADLQISKNQIKLKLPPPPPLDSLCTSTSHNSTITSDSNNVDITGLISLKTVFTIDTSLTKATMSTKKLQLLVHIYRIN
eukprot:gene8812-18237_t